MGKSTRGTATPKGCLEEATSCLLARYKYVQSHIISNQSIIISFSLLLSLHNTLSDTLDSTLSLLRARRRPETHRLLQKRRGQTASRSLGNNIRRCRETSPEFLPEELANSCNKDSHSLVMDSNDLRFFALEDGFLVFPVVSGTDRRRRDRHGRRFRGGCCFSH